MSISYCYHPQRHPFDSPHSRDWVVIWAYLPPPPFFHSDRIIIDILAHTAALPDSSTVTTHLRCWLGSVSTIMRPFWRSPVHGVTGRLLPQTRSRFPNAVSLFYPGDRLNMALRNIIWHGNICKNNDAHSRVMTSWHQAARYVWRISSQQRHVSCRAAANTGGISMYQNNQ